MKQSPRLNSEKKEMMDNLIHLVTRIFPSTEYSLSFVGSILYLKKKGADVMGNYSDNTYSHKLSEYDILLANDSLHDIVLETMAYVASFIADSKLDNIMKFVAIEEFSDDEYLYWYDYAIDNIAHNKRFVGLLNIPRGLTALAQAFICDDAKNTLVPFGGIMNFATGINSFDSLDAFQSNHQLWSIGMLRLGLKGMSEKCNLMLNNIETWPSKQYDTIISMPPLGMRLNMKTTPLCFHANLAEESELVAPCRFIESTTDEGICIAFGPTSLLTGGASKKRFRIWAMDNRILDTIILLPNNMLTETSIPLACVILKKKPFQKNAVRMIDASGLYTYHIGHNQLEVGKIMEAYRKDTERISRTVSYDEISTLDYSWNAQEYLQETEEYPEGYTLKALEELVEIPQLINSTTNDKGLSVKISNLSDDWTHPYIDSSKLSEENNLRNYTRLNKTAILLSTIRKLKPSIIKASEEYPVWINSNIMAIIPKEGIDPEFLCMTLAKLEVPSLGFGAPHISKTYLLRLKIAYPELSIQKSIYREASRENALSKVQEFGLQEVIDQMKADYINEVRARKHDMKTPMAQLRSTLLLVKELLSELPEEYASRLEKYVIRQEKAMDVLSTIVSHIADEDVFATPEVIDIESVLKSFESVTERYTIQYHRDETSLREAGIETPYLNIGKVDFIRLSQNIVSNAIKRGFVKGRTDYVLHITLSIDKDFFIIDFCNNGEPFPDGMDKVRYGTKGTKGVNSDGSGSGGYIVKSITQHYGGDFDIISSEFANMNFTNIIVKLPIYRKEDE